MPNHITNIVRAHADVLNSMLNAEGMIDFNVTTDCNRHPIQRVKPHFDFTY